MRNAFTAPGLSIYYYVVEWDAATLPWAKFRGELLGPTDPVQNEPWSATPWHRAYVPQACSPCRQGCADVHCMEALSVDLVWDCLKRLGKENASWIEGEALNEVRK